MILLLICYLL